MSIVTLKKKKSNSAPEQKQSFEWTIINKLGVGVILPNFSIETHYEKSQKSSISSQQTIYIPKPKHNLNHLNFKGLFTVSDENNVSQIIGDRSGYCPGTYTISFDSQGHATVITNEVNCPEAETEFNSSFPPMNFPPEQASSFPPMNFHSHSPM
jgi:hypothetical protein